MKSSQRSVLIKRTLLLVGSFFLAFHVMAQFTITENFRGSSVGSNIKLGGNGSGESNAYLTSGNNYGSGDPVNQGWLRLTEAQKGRAGYAYIDKSFPSTLGVVIEFEYKSWRNQADSYNGADGICVFLTDASVPFQIGGWGGSLGYANLNAPSNGMPGAYLGIGIDEFGNFANNTEQRNGGVNGLLPNSITLRGSASSGWKYLTSKQLQTSTTQDGPNSMDYNQTTAQRPNDQIFYRKVKILIVPTGTSGSPQYKITVYWMTNPNGSYTQLLSYTTSQPIPDKLKLGFTASTGGGFNYHEIRNVLITTPGNVRVQKSVDQTSQVIGNDLTYTVNITNDTPALLNGILLNDTIKDNAGKILPDDGFHIKSITFNNQGNSGNTAIGFPSGTAVTSGLSNPFGSTLNMQANSTSSFTIVGTINNMPDGGVINNDVGIDPTPTGITDVDLTNNYSTVSTTVLNPSLDLRIDKGVDNHGRAKTTGNVFSIQVTNVSNVDKSSDVNAPVVVTDTIPAGLTVTDYTGKPNGLASNGWVAAVTNNIYTFTRSDVLKSQFAYPVININVTPDELHSSWTNSANLSYKYDNNSDNNKSSAILKWYNYWYGTNGTDWAVPENWTAGFVPGEGWDVEFATTDNNSGDDGNGKGAAINDLNLDNVDQSSSGGRIIGDLVNNSDKNLVITRGNQLKINGKVVDANTSAGTIVVQADPYNATANGTLIFTDPTKNQNVGAMVEFYNKAYYCDECGLYKKQWQYFGIPVQSSATFPVGTSVSGNVTVNQWVEPFNGNKWQKAPYSPDTQLTAFRGYEITNDTHQLPTGVYSFPGTLYVGNSTVPLTRTASVNYSGANLIGNSYTAAIPIATALTTDLTDQTVYLFNTGTRDQWRKLNGSTVNLSGVAGGQYLAVPFKLAGQTPEGATTALPSMIPSTQAFMMLADKNMNLNIDYSKLVKNQTITDADGNTIATRAVTSAQSATGTSAIELPSLVMDVVGDNSADRVWIFSKSGTTYGFDSGWDGRKIGDENSAQLYVTSSDSSKLQVATVPSMNSVAVGFVPIADGSYTLEFALSKGLSNDQIYLNDLLTGKKQQIVNGGSYTFKAEKGESAGRFTLSDVSGSSSAFSDDEALISVTAENGNIKVVNASASSCSVFIADEKGNPVRRLEVKANGTETIEGMSSGVYVIRLQNAAVDDIRQVTVGGN
jgi:uncharacterized repeat protein (TIGR01451 family)